MPKGVSGAIYELDGITQVRKGIDFYVTNLDNGKIVQGKTGMGSSGGYSAAITGDNGDTILLKAWNKYHESNVTFALSGVMYGMNLMLNMTYPPLAPNITSMPIEQATEDEGYAYQVAAFDENYEDIISYSLSENPMGMSIGSSDGKISWMPGNDDVGERAIKVSATDENFITNQSYIVKVENVNDAPIIISIPVGEARQDTAYYYDVNAADDDNDALEYSLTQAPNGMLISKDSGIITWLPSNADVGSHIVSIKADDSQSAALQSFTVNVENVNDLPAITSIPSQNAKQGAAYSYNVAANDPDNDAMAFSLVKGPNGMNVDKNSGKVEWTPSNADVGIVNVSIKVSDDTGFALQSYSISVENANDAPMFISSPALSVYLGSAYHYSANASDPDNDPLEYTPIKNPDGMSIDRYSGKLQWKPKGNQRGIHNISIAASDGIISAKQEFSLSVIARAEPEIPKELRPAPVPSAGGGGGGGGGGGAGKGTPPNQFGNDFGKSKVIVGLPLDDFRVTVQEMPRRPDEVESPGRLVYKYLVIEAANLEKPEKAIINFTIPTEWVKKFRLKPGDVVLSRYHDDEWHDLPTYVISEKEDYIHYTSETPGFSYFAISSRKGIDMQDFLSPETTGVKETYRISGTAYYFGGLRQLKAGTRFIIENAATGEKTEGATGGSNRENGGMIYILASGNKGDKIKISFPDYGEEFDLLLKDQDTKLTLSIGSGFFGITGNAVFGYLAGDGYTGGLVVLTLLLAALLVARFKYRKRE
ncbi:PGF-pre-PGF domain-containing protein [Candidatus Woesearchaeota archaeon]|nr:PGF-pre-PGF domain-containing protein [Candidatus Woesearchaeota archaeon]